MNNGQGDATTNTGLNNNDQRQKVEKEMEIDLTERSEGKGEPFQLCKEDHITYQCPKMEDAQ